jgi:ribose transport system permease protein
VKQLISENKGIFGILGLLIVVCLVTAMQSDAFLKPYNIENVIRRTALFGILGIGVAFVIITGGIDLSVGSMVCLIGCGLPWLLRQHGWPVPMALAKVVLVSLGSGLFHGLMIAKMKLQPFIVTL